MIVGHDIIVVGGSAGGLEAVIEIARGLPADLPAAVLVVLHTSPESPGMIPGILGRAGPLPASHPSDGDRIEPGRIYVARPDHHLLVEPGHMRISRGPKENRFRPAVDPLFRSAALAYGPRVVGVVLTGALDDGAAGLWAVKTRGGVAIVQDVAEALIPSMPRSAMRETRVDHQLRLAEIPQVLSRLSVEPPAAEGQFPVPDGLLAETRIAMEDRALQVGVADLGEPSMFTCPECHGSLLRIKVGGGLRFRCHTGHAYSVASLLSELSDSIEGVFWNAVRTVQESSLLLEHMAKHVGEIGEVEWAETYRRKADEARWRAEFVRRMVMEYEHPPDE